MKLETKVTGITHDELVDLFSTGLTGSSFFGADWNAEDYLKCPDAKESNCFEDKLARLLLNGFPIVIFDCYAEDENDFYGDLPHRYDEVNLTMDYAITISDIERGLARCADGTFKTNDGCDDERDYIRRCLNNLIAADGNLDLYEAQNLLQVIVFNQMIYG